MLRNRRAPRHLCPGPRRPIWRHAFPHTWFLRSPCAYDLSGLVPDAGGCITCPECARRLHPAQALRSPSRIRSFRVIAAAVIAIVLVQPYARSGRWVRHTPTVLLAASERLPDTWRPARVRRELGNRIFAAPVSPLAVSMVIPPLIADLREDEVRGNALRAVDLLNAIGAPAIPALEAALLSSDWQQRHLAAHILRQMTAYTPSDTLLTVTVDGLRDDDLPRGRSAAGVYTYSGIQNASDGLAYLARFGHCAEPQLADALRTGDTQQRLLCAVAVGFAGVRSLEGEAISLLIRHLEDNGVQCDANIAAAGLFRFGQAAVPALRAAESSADLQQRSFAERVLKQIRLASAEDADATSPAIDRVITAEAASISMHDLR